MIRPPEWTAEKSVHPSDSFCLRLLEKDVVAYLVALHPDHGIPVYHETEFLACERVSLGEVIQHSFVFSVSLWFKPNRGMLPAS
jgi:hypothetical protein